MHMYTVKVENNLSSLRHDRLCGYKKKTHRYSQTAIKSFFQFKLCLIHIPASTDNTAVHERTGKSGEEKEKQCPRLKNESASDRREILSLRPS